MTRHGLDAPDALTDGLWLPNGRGTLRWVPAAPPVAPPRLCETCGADIAHKRADARFCGRYCRFVRVETQRPPRQRPTPARPARLCSCGKATLEPRRRVCEKCRLKHLQERWRRKAEARRARRARRAAA